MKIMLFSSIFPNALTYGRHFSHLTSNELVLVQLVPLAKKNDYEKKLEHFLRTEDDKLRVLTIYLRSPDSRFRNLLNPKILLADFYMIFKTLKQLKPDAIICMYILDAYPLAMLKSIFGYSLFGVATGGDINLRQGTVYELVRNFIYKRCDVVFAVSNELSQKIMKESGRKAIVVPNPIDSLFFMPQIFEGNMREKWGLRQEDFVILTVCNLVKNKGVDMIVKSISALKNDNKCKAKLIVVGEGPEKRALEELVLKLGLKLNTVFLGFRNRDELLELYNIADLFILASYSEGLPAVLLEAMACENVCISTNVGDVGRVITEGFNGFLVDCGNPIMLTKKIEEIFSLPEKQASSIRKQARKTVTENYDFRNSTKVLLEMITSTYSRKKSRQKMLK